MAFSTGLEKFVATVKSNEVAESAIRQNVIIALGDSANVALNAKTSVFYAVPYDDADKFIGIIRYGHKLDGKNCSIDFKIYKFDEAKDYADKLNLANNINSEIYKKLEATATVKAEVKFTCTKKVSMYDEYGDYDDYTVTMDAFRFMADDYEMRQDLFEYLDKKFAVPTLDSSEVRR